MKAILLAVLAGLCWGIGELFTKSVLHTGRVGPMTMVLVRALVTVPPAILAWVVASRVLGTEPSGWWRGDPGLLAKLLLGSALLAGFGGVFFFYWGLSLGEISVVKPIAFTVGPAAAVLLAWLVLGEPMSVRKGAGVVLVLAGVVLIAGARRAERPVEAGSTGSASVHAGPERFGER